MMFHHLNADEKKKTLREIHRVLKRGGRLEMLDFAGPESNENRSWLFRLLHSHHHLQDNSESRILALMAEAGFLEPKKLGQRSLLLGEVVYYQTSVPIS